MPSTTPLPNIMVAPNGARRGKDHHPAIPLTENTIVETVIQCHNAGADGAHLHIRDSNGQHLLDAQGYQSLLERLEPLVPEMYLQVTSESAGIYEADQQQAIVQALKPRFVSVAMREMVRTPKDWPKARMFYDWANNHNVDVHHILYSTEELDAFLSAVSAGNVVGHHHLLQFVLGTYDGTQVSDPAQVSAFVDKLDNAPDGLSFDWMLCAFGKEETDCLVEAIRQGGKARIGFENSLWHSDGSMAEDNADRVAELLKTAPAHWG